MGGYPGVNGWFGMGEAFDCDWLNMGLICRDAVKLLACQVLVHVGEYDGMNILNAQRKNVKASQNIFID